MKKPIVVKPSKRDRDYANLQIARHEALRLGHLVREPHDWTRRLELLPADRPLEEIYRETVKRFGKVSDELEALERRQLESKGFSEVALQNPQRRAHWTPGADWFDNGGQTPYAFGGGRVFEPVTVSPPTIGIGPAPPPPSCYIHTTISSNKAMYSITTEPDDGDSTKSIAITPDASGAAGPWDSLFHHAEIKDKTHWYWFDDSECYVYWCALGYQLPPAPCEVWLGWHCYFTHSVSLWGTAEDRLIFSKILIYPRGGHTQEVRPGVYVGDTHHDPETVHDFAHIIGSEVAAHNRNGQWLLDGGGSAWFTGTLGGSTRLKKNEVFTVWVGFYTILSCLDGRAATGPNELRIWTIHPVTRQQVRGITFQMSP
ncbi:MAG TPA: hypothetical protein PLA43_20155 [Bryobacteraceae bacterium]|nr:hypothetical protein [Bryobacteraceae bacterium]HOQ47234.1 hypothetical protein [Bryobacteraceae bacterium]HPQ14391.1 hypothetical protein [Bryobacteraceae bacterium]HPU74273.1 hypothetical protein [Bryobacteraceae bacterium]